MTVYNWVTLAVIVIGWAVTWGRTVQKLNQIERDVTRLDGEIARQANFRDSHFVSTDRYDECTADIKRRLDEVNTLDINTRLARIETMLDQIQITLNGGK